MKVSPEARKALYDKIKNHQWTAGVNSDGYPKVKIDGKSYLASHVLLETLGRPVPPGKVVMHRDNNPKNLNPKNLVIGTQQQNLKQMRDEGRDRPRGVPQEPDNPSKKYASYLGLGFGIPRSFQKHANQRMTWIPQVFPYLGIRKVAELKTKLLPHQERVRERMKQEDQPGLVLAHGLGTGKTLSSIAIHDALGVPATVVVPAALKANYIKEQEKHIKGKPLPTSLETIQAAATHGSATPNPLLIVDEAHKLRDPASESHKAIKHTPSEKRVLLTASPFYNHPHDLAPLINLVAQQEILPKDRKTFENLFIEEVKTNPTFWQKLRHRGLQGGVTLQLNPKTAPELKKIFEKWVDYHPGSKENFPRVRREEVEVLMTPTQKDIYNTTLDAAPPWVAAKVRSGLPPSKKEMASLSAFLTGPRQVGVSTRGFTTKGEFESPKIEKAFERLKQMLDANEQAKAVIYSNYLDSGIGAYKEKLLKSNIPFGEFTGDLTPKERDQMVRDYNEGKIRALLLSSAGGEGLDLKGTRLVQILEPHWNQEKLKQVEGRAARFKSHAHLPPEEQEVLIEQYLSLLEPKKREGIMAVLFGKERKNRTQSADEYLYQLSKDKERLIEQFRSLLPDSSSLNNKNTEKSTKN